MKLKVSIHVIIVVRQSYVNILLRSESIETDHIIISVQLLAYDVYTI